MMKREELRHDFHNEQGINWENSQGEPDIDYVMWLENKILAVKNNAPLPPAEGAENVQWSGYGELGNIKQSKLPTEDDIEKTATRLMRCYLKPETAFEVRKAFIAGAEYVLGSGAFTEQPQPTAEGAEEILKKYIIYCKNVLAFEGKIWVVKDIIPTAMQEFATLHAQKMTQENLREELIAYDKYASRWIDNYRAETAEDCVDEYLKSKEQ